MTARTNSDDLRPAPLPPNKKSLEFTRAVFKHSFTPSRITDLVKGLRDMRSDVETCLTKLETTFQHVHDLYDIMNNGLARIASRASIFSTSTNLTVRIQLAGWLKGLEGTWGLSRKRRPVPVSHPVSAQIPSHFIFGLQLRDFLRPKHVTVGTSYMTDDLLGKIFYHLCESGPLSLRRLLFVSKRFYSATVNNAHLWTTISHDSSFFHYFRQRPDQGTRFVEQCLLRSVSLPLCLYIGCFQSEEDDPSFLLPLLKTFGRPEWRGFQRCASLTLDASYHRTITIQAVVNMLPESLPSLKHISFTYFGGSINGPKFPDCPVLERVEMLHHLRPSPHFWGRNFSHVTALSFGYTYYWLDIDLTTLSLFPVLRGLTLFTLQGMGGLYGVNPQLPVILENLHILRAHGRIPCEVLTMLVTPALEELHLVANINNFTSTDALQTSFNPPCRYIQALLPKAVSAEEPNWALKLSKLVQKCTMVKSLSISRWMEEEYRKCMSGQDVVLHVQ